MTLLEGYLALSGCVATPYALLAVGTGKPEWARILAGLGAFFAFVIGIAALGELV